MSNRTTPVLPILAVLLTATAGAADAQYGGGMGGGGMGGHHGGGRRSQKPQDDSPPAQESAPARAPETPTNKIQIVGVIRAIDPATQRVTISYDEVDALNWPAGTTPFVVAKPSLLQGATVGEKVRFEIDSQQISAMEPYTPPARSDGD